MFVLFSWIQLAFAKSLPYDKNTIMNLLKYSRSSYETSNLSNYLFSFGNEMGLSAKVFSELNYIVVSFKGTTLDLPMLKTDIVSKNNKIFDNIMYECCKNDECIHEKRNAIKNHPYILDSLLFIRQLKRLFPGKKIRLTGHSLGGTIASIIGRIEKTEVLAFGSPGEKYVSDLITKNDESKIFHLGMCNDPIFNGDCDNIGSICSLMGYKLQTKCHSGTSFCIDIPFLDNILFHKLEVIEYLFYRDWSYKIQESKNCSECDSNNNIVE